MDNAEKITTDPLEKPTSFEHAQQVEKNCVAFAKDVRKANKMLAKVDELVKALVNNKTTVEQQIEEQVRNFSFFLFLQMVNYSEDSFQENCQHCSYKSGKHERPSDKVNLYSLYSTIHLHNLFCSLDGKK